jgi:hypothetical protein
MDCTKIEHYLSNENHSHENNFNYFFIPLKINSLEGQKVLDKAFDMSYNILILNNKGKNTMKYILSDIKKGYKISTIMKRNQCSATLVIACMNIIQKSAMRAA